MICHIVVNMYYYCGVLWYAIMIWIFCNMLWNCLEGNSCYCLNIAVLFSKVTKPTRIQNETSVIEDEYLYSQPRIPIISKAWNRGWQSKVLKSTKFWTWSWQYHQHHCKIAWSWQHQILIKHLKRIRQQPSSTIACWRGQTSFFL